MNKFYEKKGKKIKNKPIDSEIKLLDGFLQSNSHCGTLAKDLHVKNYRYIYGIRSKQTLINLNITVQSVKRAFLMVGKILQKRRKGKRHLRLRQFGRRRFRGQRRPQTQKILIVCNDIETKGFNQAFKKTPFRKKIVYLHEDWVGGFITNPLLLGTRLKNVSLIIGLNETHDNLLLQAAKRYRIPFMSVINTHMDSSLIPYPIVMNTKNLQSTFFLMFLLKKYISNLSI